MSNDLAILIRRAGGLGVLPDNKTHTNRFEIPSSSSSRVYTIAMRVSTGEWECSCPGWVLKKPGRPRGCQHLTAMGSVLTQIAALTGRK